MLFALLFVQAMLPPFLKADVKCTLETQLSLKLDNCLNQDGLIANCNSVSPLHRGRKKNPKLFKCSFFLLIEDWKVGEKSSLLLCINFVKSVTVGFSY